MSLRRPALRASRRHGSLLRFCAAARFLCVGACLSTALANPAVAAAAADEERVRKTPLAQIEGETIYVEDVEGALAFRIYKHQLDIYALLKAEAESRIEKQLLGRAAKERGITVEELLAEVEGTLEDVGEDEIDQYLAEHPPTGARDSKQARVRVRHYLSERARLERRVAFMERLHAEAGTKILLDAPKPPRTQVDVEGAPVRGPAAAAVEIVHFASFGSRNSARSAGKIGRLRKAFPGEIRHVHRNLLGDRDELGLAAARIGFVAAESDRFWTLHDRFFADETKRPSIAEVETFALELGLPAEGVRTAGTEIRRLQQVKSDIDAANAAGAPREPALFINGRFVSGLQTFDEMRKIVAEEIEAARGASH